MKNSSCGSQEKLESPKASVNNLGGSMRLAPCAPGAQLQRQETSIYLRNTDLSLSMTIDKVNTSHAAFVDRTEDLIKMKEDRTKGFLKDKNAKTKKEATRRISLWMQTIFSIASVHKMQNSAEQLRAKLELQYLLGPMVRKWKCRRRTIARQRDMLFQREDLIPKLTVADLKQLEFFKSWKAANLSELIPQLKPDTFKEGDYICMEGDWGDEMYILMSGTVDIYIRNPKKRTKKRGKGGLVVATLSCLETDAKRVPKYFGEFGILCREPRGASIIAMTPFVDVWKVSAAVLNDTLDKLPLTVKESLLTMADIRRATNMEKLYPIDPKVLARSSKIFKELPEYQIQDLLKKFKPRIFRAKDIILQEGTFGDCLYFIASGSVQITSVVSEPALEATSLKVTRCALTSPKTPKKPLPSPLKTSKKATPDLIQPIKEKLVEKKVVLATLFSGSTFGEMSVVFLEPRSATVMALTPCDLWSLNRSDLSDLSLTNPDWFINSKHILNKLRATWLPQCSVSQWAGSPLLNQLGISMRGAREMHPFLTPFVVEKSEVIVKSNNEISSVVFVVKGSVEKKAAEVEPETQRVFGAAELMTFQTYWPFTLRAVTRCDCWVCPKNIFIEKITKFLPHVIEQTKDEDWHTETTTAFGLPYIPQEDRYLDINMVESDGSPPVSPSASRCQSPVARNRSLSSSVGQSPTARNRSLSSCNQSPTARNRSPSSCCQSPTARNRSPSSSCCQSPTARNRSPSTRCHSPTSLGVGTVKERRISRRVSAVVSL